MTIISKQKVADIEIYSEADLRQKTRWGLKSLAKGRGFEFKGDNKNPQAAELIEFCLAWQEKYQEEIPNGEPVSEKTAAKIAEVEEPESELLPPQVAAKKNGTKSVHTKDLSARLDKLKESLLEQLEELAQSLNTRYDRLENQNRMVFLFLQELYKLAGDEDDIEGIIEAINENIPGDEDGDEGNE